MKSMLLAVWENTPVLDTYTSYLETSTDGLTRWSIKVKINEEYTKSIVDAYSCAKTSICNSSFKNSIKDLTDFSKFTTSLSDSWNVIQKAGKNLSAALWSRKNYNWIWWWIKKEQKTDWIWLTDRQIELLHTVYWIDAYSLTTPQLDTFEQNFAQLKKEIEPMSSALTSGYMFITSLKNKRVLPEEVDIPKEVSKRKFVKESIVVLITQPLQPLADGFRRLLWVWEGDENKLANNLSEGEKRERLDTIFWQEIRPESEKNVLWANTMQVTIDKILVDKSKDKEYVMIWQNRDTHYFVEIWAYIHSIVKDVIWDKGTWLIKNLWETCTYQCGNHWTDNCYAK